MSPKCNVRRFAHSHADTLRVCSVGHNIRIAVPGVFLLWARTERTEVSGTGIEFIPNLTGPECSVGR